MQSIDVSIQRLLWYIEGFLVQRYSSSLKFNTVVTIVG